MNCRRVRQYLYAYCRQELSPDETKEVKAHLDFCPECTEKMEVMVATEQMIRDGLENFVPSPDFNEKLLAKIQSIPSTVEERTRKSWWRKLLHETFPSIRLRWALAGAVSVIFMALVATIFTQKQISKQPGSYAFDSTNTENRKLTSSGNKIDTSLEEIFKQVDENTSARSKTFVMENLSSPSLSSGSRLVNWGEDGRIKPVDFRKRFIIERSSYQDARRGSNYVLPVVSTQPASKKTDF